MSVFFCSKFFLFVVLLALKSINNNQIVNSSSHQDRHHVYIEWVRSKCGALIPAFPHALLFNVHTRFNFSNDSNNRFWLVFNSLLTQIIRNDNGLNVLVCMPACLPASQPSSRPANGIHHRLANWIVRGYGICQIIFMVKSSVTLKPVRPRSHSHQHTHRVLVCLVVCMQNKV